MTDLRLAVAKPFQIEGTGSLEPKKFKMILSFKLGWFEPSGASDVVERALERGLVKMEGEELVPTFDVNDVEVPLEFEPAADFTDQDPMDELISRVADSLDMNRSKVVAGANRVQHEHGIHLTMDASVLLFALNSGERFRDEATRAAADLRG